MEGALRQGGNRPGLRLIETMAWEGGVLRRWPLHLARLQAGAAALGWPAPVAADLLAAVSAVAPGYPARLRLTLARAGDIAVEVGAMPALRAPWRLGLAAARLRSDDPWLGIKSTERGVYDAARAALPSGLDECVFANERDAVCDGTITTVFFDRGAGMRTPPLTAGLLPGILRADMIASGAVSEEVLHVSDLPHVRLWVGNALRGLIPAVWIG